MTGTLRTMSEDRREFMKRRVNEIARAVASGMGGSATVEWLPNRYPVTVNDPDLTSACCLPWRGWLVLISRRYLHS
jgi:metal-dependent amidase/aminoacylase/carboxypeptidase family protein